MSEIKRMNTSAYAITMMIQIYIIPETGGYEIVK